MKAEQIETHIRLQETVRGINGRHQLSEEHHHEDSQHCLKTMKLKMETNLLYPGLQAPKRNQTDRKERKKRKIKERKRGLW